MSPILGTSSSLSAIGYGFLGGRDIITIISQPTSAAYAEGSTATFTVVAGITGGTITYQWQKSDDSGVTWNNIGTNSNSYTTPALSVANDSGDRYRCILSSPLADTVTSNEAVITVASADLSVTPSVNGKTAWVFAVDGPLILDGGSDTTYTISPARNFSKITKMWGQGRSGGTGGYSTGQISFGSGSTYTVKLNYGGGNSGVGYGNRTNSAQPGGGLAGMFAGTSINQGTAMMIAGGAGGGGDGSSGGGGGGTSGNSGQTSSNTQIGSTGGGGGTSSSGGSAGSPTNTNVYYYLDSSQNVSFYVTEQSGIFNYLEIVGIKNFPENNTPNPETISVSAGTYLVRSSTGTVRVDPTNSQRAQVNDGGGSWDDIEVLASAGTFYTNIPATAGSALQGGVGGGGAISQYTNAAGGGGGGGGWYGGGGGGGGNDFGSTTRNSSGGGGGSGYINGSYVTSGSTSTFADGSDPQRGSAGNQNANSRVVIYPIIAPTTFQTATSINYNPATQSSPNYGWYTRSGGSESTPNTDVRQLVIKWGGSVILNTTSIVPYYDGTYYFVVVGGFAYFAGTHRGSQYGWPANGIDVGPAASPDGDFANAFDVARTAY